jgi:hypothetical protein
MAGVLVVAGVALQPVDAGADVHVSGGVVITDRTDGGYRGGYRGDGPAFRYGYDRGWREGSEEGRHDGRKRRDPRYWREGEFRDGDRGYRGWMGPRWDFVRGFREGYEAGYRRAYAASRPGWYGGGRERWGRGRYDERYRRDDGRYDPDERYRRDDRDRR